MELNHKVTMSIKDWRDFEDEEDISLAYGKVTFLSTKENSHKHKYSEEVLKRDAKTFLGKFLVTDYDDLTADSTTHTDTQNIVGYIPTNQEVLFDRDEEGYLQATVDVVISKIYAPKVYKMFKDKNFRSVSVESLVGFSEDTKDYQDGIDEKIVEGFEGIGITILGLRYNPSVPTANITLTKMSADNVDNIEKEYQEYSHKENKTMSTVIEKLDNIKNSIDNMTHEEYDTELGYSLWNKIEQILLEKYPKDDYGSQYYLRGIFEEDNSNKKYIIIEDSSDGTLFKIQLFTENNEVKLSEDLIKVEISFIESNNNNMEEKMSEEKKKDEEMATEEKDETMAKSEEEKEKEEMAETDKKEEAKEEKKDDSESKKEKEEEKSDEKMAELEKENKNLKEVNASQLAELEVLREFKTSVEKERKSDVIMSTLEKVKDYVDEAKYKEFEDSAESYSYANIEGWKNEVLASITDILMSKKDDVMDMGVPYKETKKSESIYD